ncbi:hypothetical protein O181_020518 [Austropuccinia psidii MF-1]|uniref:Uncharacterized protein n=1 Tax=Austropuccinia psidii MF-1 TaxID=1389203 RepID=A0A9Q3GUK9_9BASI|nr:hypothetical protein [Austropuccinia psidii MF-1]
MLAARYDFTGWPFPAVASIPKACWAFYCWSAIWGTDDWLVCDGHRLLTNPGQVPPCPVFPRVLTDFTPKHTVSGKISLEGDYNRHINLDLCLSQPTGNPGPSQKLSREHPPIFAKDLGSSLNSAVSDNQLSPKSPPLASLKRKNSLSHSDSEQRSIIRTKKTDRHPSEDYSSLSSRESPHVQRDVGADKPQGLSPSVKFFPRKKRTANNRSRRLSMSDQSTPNIPLSSFSASEAQLGAEGVPDDSKLSDSEEISKTERIAKIGRRTLEVAAEEIQRAGIQKQYENFYTFCSEKLNSMPKSRRNDGVLKLISFSAKATLVHIPILHSMSLVPKFPVDQIPQVQEKALDQLQNIWCLVLDKAKSSFSQSGRFKSLGKDRISRLSNYIYVSDIGPTRKQNTLGWLLTAEWVRSELQVNHHWFSKDDLKKGIKERVNKVMMEPRNQWEDGVISDEYRHHG